MSIFDLKNTDGLIFCTYFRLGANKSETKIKNKKAFSEYNIIADANYY